VAVLLDKYSCEENTFAIVSAFDTQPFLDSKTDVWKEKRGQRYAKLSSC
jgi:hypothetical protein